MLGRFPGQLKTESMESEDLGHCLVCRWRGSGSRELSEIKGLRTASHLLAPRERADSGALHGKPGRLLVSPLLSCPISQPSGLEKVFIFSRLLFLSLQSEVTMSFSNGQYSFIAKRKLPGSCKVQELL